MQTSKFVLRVEDANSGGPWQGDLSEKLDRNPYWDSHGNRNCTNMSTHPTPAGDLHWEDYELMCSWNEYGSARCAVKDFEMLFHWFDGEGVWQAFADNGFYLSVYECEEYVEGRYQICLNIKAAKKICSVSFKSLIKE